MRGSNNTPDGKPRQMSLFEPPQLSNRIRRVVQDEIEYFSLVDIMAEFTDLDSRPSVLWGRTKKRLKVDGFELYQKVIQLKLKSADGKSYKTDCADGQTVLRIIQSIPSAKAEPVRKWLAEQGYQALEARAALKRQSNLALMERAGWSNHPEVQRLRDRDANIQVFKSLKSTIGRICEHPEWGKIINAEYSTLFGSVAKVLEGILETNSVRDALPSLQLTALTYAERSLQVVLSQKSTASNQEIIHTIVRIITPIRDNLKAVCDELGVHHVTGQKLING